MTLKIVYKIIKILSCLISEEMMAGIHLFLGDIIIQLLNLNLLKKIFFIQMKNFFCLKRNSNAHTVTKTLGSENKICKYYILIS